MNRLLEFWQGDGKFLHDQDNPFKADAVIVDETFLADTLLACHLQRAIPRNASLLLVGDVDQLPSVGPRNVLRDILDSGAVPAVMLNAMLRHEARSHILEQAHRINRGL